MNNQPVRSKIRFGLVGFGTHGKGAVAPGIMSSRNCELVAISDLLLEEGAVVEGAKCYRSFEKMLREEQLDAVYIATLPELHCEQVLMALRYRKHVVCEKPMAANAEEAELMAAAAERAGCLLAIMFENRFTEYNRQIKAWIEAGYLGRIEAIHIQSFRKHPTAQPRRTNLLNAAGCLDCGIHQLDLVRFWLRETSWEVIRSLGSWFDEPVHNPPHIGVLARLNNGTMVTFDNSFSFGYGVEHTPFDFGKESLVIVGSEGVIRDQGECKGGFSLISKTLTDFTPYVLTYHFEEIPIVLDEFACMVWGEESTPSLLALAKDGVEAQRAVDEINGQARKSRYQMTEEVGV